VNLAVFVYVALAGFAGFFTVAYANSFAIRRWLRLALAAVLVIPSVLALSALLSAIGLGKGAVTVFGFGFFFGILSLVELVLSVVGGTLAYKRRLFGEAPCPVAAIPRAIPELPLWARAPFLGLLIGFLSFAPVSVELFYVLTAFWNSQSYSSYGLLFPTVLLMITTIGGLTILAVSIRFQCECHRWQWFSFFAPCGSGLWLIGGCLWFYIWKVDPLGWVTTAYFFGITGLLCAFVALIAGATGFFAATCFVRFTFSNLKLD
jgi:transmembrane 9 superfamily protein 2/4